MIPAAGNQGDPLFDPHAPQRSVMGQHQGDGKAVRGSKGDGLLHGPVGNAAFPGEDGTVCHKSGQSQRFQLSADIVLVFAQKNRLLHLGSGEGTVKKGGQDAARKIVKKDFFQFACQHRAACGRESHFKADHQVGRGKLAGRAGQYFLPRPADPDKAAFAGTSRLEGKTAHGAAKAAQDIVCQRSALVGRIQEGFRESRPPAADMDA